MKENSALDRVQPRYRSALVLLVAIAILVGVELVDEFYLAKSQPIAGDIFPLWLRNWDLAGFILLNERLASPFLDPLMSVVTHFGSTVFWLLVSAFLWVGNRKREAVLLAVGVIIGGLIFMPIKIVVPRARPYLVVEGARILDIEGGGSFPSGHSKNGFTAAVILGSRWKRLTAPLYILAFLIALSRVYVGLHWPFDIIVGSIVGWIIGKVTTRYETKIMAILNRTVHQDF